jgi:hypothetical protein
MAAVGSRQQGSPPARLRPAAAAALPSSAALLTGVRAGLSNILAPMRSPMRGPDPHAAGSGASSPTLAPGSPTSSSSTRGARGHPGGTAWHIAASHTTMTVRPQPSPGRARPVSSSFDFGKPGASTVLQRTPHLSGPTGAGGKPPLARAAAHGLGRGALGDAGTSATTAPRSAPSSPLRGSVAALPTAPGRVVAEPLPHTRYAAPSATRATPAGTDGGTIRMPRNLWEDVPVSSTLGSSRGAGSALQDVGGASSTGPPTLRAWEAGQDQEGHSDSVAEEERAVGLHRVRSSIQRLEVATQEAAARSRSPSPSSSRASPSLAGSAVAGVCCPPLMLVCMECYSAAVLVTGSCPVPVAQFCLLLLTRSSGSLCQLVTTDLADLCSQVRPWAGSGCRRQRQGRGQDHALTPPPHLPSLQLHPPLVLILHL